MYVASWNNIIYYGLQYLFLMCLFIANDNSEIQILKQAVKDMRKELDDMRKCFNELCTWSNQGKFQKGSLQIVYQYLKIEHA